MQHAENKWSPITQFSSIHQNKFVKIIKDQNILYLEENSKINQN